jgi:hypothetical protein
MTLKRRLDAIEPSLSPTQLVLRWLAEAHTYDDVPAYVISLLTQEPPVAPLDRLARDAERVARTAMRGKRPEVISAAVRSALRETVFRFELVMRINVTVHDLLDHEALLEALFAAHLALLLHDDRKQRLADESHLHRLAQCRDLTALQLQELVATRDAISRVEARYLEGRGALFPEVAGALEDQIRRSQELAVMATDSAELDGVEPPEPEDPDTLESRTGQLMADLVEPAKSTALEKLGEGKPAFDIANAWLRAKLGIVEAASTVTG